MAEENFRYYDRIFSCTSYHIRFFISITNWWTPVHEQDSLKYRQNDTKKDMLQKMTVFPASYLSLIQWQTARKYRAVCFLDGINQITSTNNLTPAIFTFVRIFLKVWKSRFFQFLQTWDASIQILFDSPDGTVKSGNHRSKFHIHQFIAKGLCFWHPQVFSENFHFF